MNRIECPVRNHMAGSPHIVAVYEEGREYTYLDLDKKITILCDLLSDKGIKSGMRVSLVTENSFRYIALIFALLRLGCTLVPVNFRFSKREIEEIVREMGVDVLIPDPDDLFSVDSIGVSADRKPVLLTGKTLILTSGSTGVPKGVLLSMANHHFSAMGANRNIRLSPGDKWYLKLPLFHVGGLAILFRVFLAGAAVVVPSEAKEGILGDMNKFGITHLSLVQSQLRDLLRKIERSKVQCPGTLRAVLAGGGTIFGPVLQDSLRLEVPVYKTYGLTEMGSQVTTTSEPVTKGNMNISGTPLEHRQISIGSDGDVLVKGETLFEGYVSGGVFTPAEVDPRGWFDTGDLGYLDNDGALVITGRRDNMFISGGENIFPEEIEKKLISLQTISDAVVVPADHPEFGKRPVAFIKFSSGAGLLSEVFEALKQKLAGFKIPDRFYHFPEQDRGKLKWSRKELEDAVASGVGLREISD